MIAYTDIDSHEIFRHLAKKRIKPVIKVRRDVVITGNRVRNEAVMGIRKGIKQWKEKN